MRRGKCLQQQTNLGRGRSFEERLKADLFHNPEPKRTLDEASQRSLGYLQGVWSSRRLHSSVLHNQRQAEDYLTQAEMMRSQTIAGDLPFIKIPADIKYSPV